MYVQFLESNADVDILNKTYSLQEANEIISKLNPFYEKKRRKNEVVFQITHDNEPVYKGVLKLGSPYDLVQHIERTLETVETINTNKKEKFITLLHEQMKETKVEEPIFPDLEGEGWEEFSSELERFLGKERELFNNRQQAELYQLFLNLGKEHDDRIQPFQMASIIFDALKEQIIHPEEGSQEFERFKTYIKAQVQSIPYHEYWQIYRHNKLYQIYCGYIKETKNTAITKIQLGDLKNKLYEDQLLQGQTITKRNANNLIETVVASLIEKEIVSDNTGKAEKYLAPILPEAYQRGDILSKKELTSWYKEAGADVSLIELIHGQKELYRADEEKEVIQDILQNGFDSTYQTNSQIIHFFDQHAKRLLLYLKNTFNPKEVKEQLYQSFILENDESGEHFKVWGASHYINQHIRILGDYLEES